MFDYLFSRPQIRHPHIAPEDIINGNDGPPTRLGFHDAIGFIVRPSCPAGNILEFLSACPKQDSEKLRLVSDTLFFEIPKVLTTNVKVIQVASALEYLHSLGIVHGNICPVCHKFVICK